MSAGEGRAIRFRSLSGVWLPVLMMVGLLLVAAPAHAQTAFGVALEASSLDLVAEDMACVDQEVTVTNTGESPIPPQHTVDITTQGPGDDWRVGTAPPETLELAAGASGRFTVTICPLPSVEDGARTSYTVRATVSEVSSLEASDELTWTITASRDGFFGLDLPNSALWIALAGVAALVALVLLTRSRASGGVSVTCPEASKTVSPGRGTSFPIRIRNDGRGKDVVSLATTPVPPGWDTFLPLVDIPLESREEQTVWLSVKSPADAQSGDHLVVKVTARSSSAIGEQATIDTLTTVREATPKQASPPPDEESSVYDRSDEGDEPEEARPVAVKRRKR